MGSFFSTLFTPPPMADDPNSAVVAAHSKATYDEQWAAAKSSGKLVSAPLPFPSLPFGFSSLPPHPVLRLGCSGSEVALSSLLPLGGRCRW
jgi:hypothetical protein